MKKFEISIIGEFYTNHNEDFLVIEEMGDDKLLIAVMDGCSMGKESYFSSVLVGKILRKISKGIDYKEFINKSDTTLTEYLKTITQELFVTLRELKNQLLLEKEELLSTLIIGVVSIKDRKAEILAIGDGLICCNGIYTEYDQDDRPDYLGYYLDDKFEDWFEVQKQHLSCSDIKDLSICTDGILSFKTFDNRYYKPVNEIEIIDFLLQNTEGVDTEKMFHKKLMKIEKDWGVKPTDDLSIIRIIYA